MRSELKSLLPADNHEEVNGMSKFELFMGLVQHAPGAPHPTYFHRGRTPAPATATSGFPPPAIVLIRTPPGQHSKTDTLQHQTNRPVSDAPHTAVGGLGR